jgi:hypothetical protein
MTGLMQRILRRRASGSPGRGDAGPPRRLPFGLSRKRADAKRLPWGKQASATSPVAHGTQETEVVVQQAPPPAQPSFRDRGKLRRRLRFLRRARELAFRDIGGLMFDMRRFGRERPDLVESKIGALAAVDTELRALERILDDRRPLHELREPGITSCARCGALHSSESNFCPHCGLQVGGARAMGEVGGAIAAPPQAPPPPGPAQLSAAPAVGGQAPAPSAPPDGRRQPAPSGGPSDGRRKPANAPSAPSDGRRKPAPSSTGPADGRRKPAPSSTGPADGRRKPAPSSGPPTEAMLPPHGPDDGS